MKIYAQGQANLNNISGPPARLNDHKHTHALTHKYSNTNTLTQTNEHKRHYDRRHYTHQTEMVSNMHKTLFKSLTDKNETHTN